MNTVEHNRRAWDKQSGWDNPWSIPVTAEQVRQARRGAWKIYVTPQKPVPGDWLGELKGKSVLCLASGGGQQGPILAAAGALVTVLDNSSVQLGKDILVAQREGLRIDTVHGSMLNLEWASDGAFDLVVNPVSIAFVPEIQPVWNEAFRVLRPDGTLVCGFGNPAKFIFDVRRHEQSGELLVKNKLPYSETATLDEASKRSLLDQGEPLYHSHSMDSIIGGILKSGLVVTGFYEDSDPADDHHTMNDYLPTYFAIKADKRC